MEEPFQIGLVLDEVNKKLIATAAGEYFRTTLDWSDTTAKTFCLSIVPRELSGVKLSVFTQKNTSLRFFRMFRRTETEC